MMMIIIKYNTYIFVLSFSWRKENVILVIWYLSADFFQKKREGRKCIYVSRNRMKFVKFNV